MLHRAVPVLNLLRASCLDPQICLCAAMTFMVETYIARRPRLMSCVKLASGVIPTMLSCPLNRMQESMRILSRSRRKISCELKAPACSRAVDAVERIVREEGCPETDG